MSTDYPLNIIFPKLTIVGGVCSPESNGENIPQRFAATSRSYNSAGRRHVQVPIIGGDIYHIVFCDQDYAPTMKTLGGNAMHGCVGMTGFNVVFN